MLINTYDWQASASGIVQRIAAGRLIMEGEPSRIVERTPRWNQQANYTAIGFGCTRNLRARLFRLGAQGIT
jgi:hypothetical protein